MPFHVDGHYEFFMKICSSKNIHLIITWLQLGQNTWLLDPWCAHMIMRFVRNNYCRTHVQPIKTWTSSYLPPVVCRASREGRRSNSRRVNSLGATRAYKIAQRTENVLTSHLSNKFLYKWLFILQFSWLSGPRPLQHANHRFQSR
jgi:hypothetical protein